MALPCAKKVGPVGLPSQKGGDADEGTEVDLLSLDERTRYPPFRSAIAARRVVQAAGPVRVGLANEPRPVAGSTVRAVLFVAAQRFVRHAPGGHA